MSGYSTGRRRSTSSSIDYTLHESETLFYAVGRERGYFERDGKRLDLAIRTSRVFRKLDGRWQQVHHHGSMEDPTLLERYQKAVRGEAF
ncbi:MAG: nuclear transport factor 2 family protein [Pseudomonadota bacterium]